MVVDLTQLTLAESALTGESLPVAKAVPAAGAAAADGGGGSDGDRGGDLGGGRDEATVWAGTTVVSGRALVRVAATGTSTRYGRIGTLVAGVRQAVPPVAGLLKVAPFPPAGWLVAAAVAATTVWSEPLKRRA